MATANRISEIWDLVNQWEQSIGHTVSVADWMVNEMAGQPERYETLFDVGQYFGNHIGDTSRGDIVMDPTRWGQMPWAQFGMTLTEYDTHLAAFNSSFRQLTGVDAPQDIITQALSQNQGRMSGPQFETWLLAQDNIKQQYGWLKYGLDFQGFQQQKLQMNQGFGGVLTDAEAVAQLQYHHAAQGRDLTAVARPQSQQQQKGTAAVSGSVVR